MQRTITNPIQDDWHCISCGYSLIGLDPAGACPECGTRLALSLRKDGLAHANPLWMARLSVGVALLFVWMTIELICDVPLYTPLAYKLNSTTVQIVVNISTAIPALFWAAAWIIATPTYVTAGKYRYLGWHWGIRVTLPMLLIFWAISPFTHYPMVLLTNWLLYNTLFILVWLYLRVLARRIPYQEWVGQAMVYIVCSVVVAIIDLLREWERLFQLHLPHILPYVQGFITIATLALAVYLLARLSIRLAACTKSAMENYLPEEKQMNQVPANSDQTRIIEG